MSLIRFLSAEKVWAELSARSARAKRVHAAVAYFGTNGCELLKLKDGDTLLVDMSLGAVRQGVTNPQEIKRLISRGVKVYWRDSLHAKFFLMDRTLYCGSANVSSRSCNSLDEACVATTSASALRAAKAYFDRMCSQPVTPQYLEQCISEYQPPRFKAARMPPKQSESETARAWLIVGVYDWEPPEAEERLIDRALENAEAEPVKPSHSIDWIRYSFKPPFFDQLRRGQYIINSLLRDGGKKVVQPPALVLNKRTYRSARRKPCYLVILSRPSDGRDMPFDSFIRRAGKIVPGLGARRARTQPILDPTASDAILRFWTHTGAIRKHRC